MSSQKIYGLCGLKHHIVDIRDHVTRRDGQTTNEQTREDRATQLLGCRKAEFRNNRSLVMMKVNEDDDADDE